MQTQEMSQSASGNMRRQIADGGRIIIPVGDEQDSQRMCCFTRRGDELVKEDLGGFVFVPLVGDDGW